MEEKIVADYAEGLTQVQLCEKYSISKRKLDKIFKSHKVVTRQGRIKTGQNILCKTCNIEFYAAKNKIKEGVNNFCSKECYNNFHQCAWEQKCKCCGEIFTTSRKTSIYCSRECYKKDFTPINFDKLSKQGNIQLTKCDKPIHYDSSYELRRLYQYELNEDVIKFERCVDKIKYFYDGRWRFYHPDFKVFYKDRIVVEEIKGYIGNLEISKFKAGKSFYTELGIEYKIVTINTLETDNLIPPLINVRQTDDFVYTKSDKIYTYLSMLIMYSKMATCIRNKVACFIFSKSDFNDDSHGDFFLGQGYNTGVCKSLEAGKCQCKHAEQVAFEDFETSSIFEKFKDVEKTVLLTLSPCFSCAKLLLANNVKEVYYISFYRDSSGIRFLKKNGITCTSYKDYFNERIKNA